MWNIKSLFKRHLKYHNITAWFYGESIPENFFVEYGSGRRPDYKKYVEQFCELQKYLYQRHFNSLPKELRSQIAKGQHPSQSHERGHLAEITLQSLKDNISKHDFVKSVTIKFAQMNMIQFNVVIHGKLTVAQAEKIPEYIDGYIVKIVWDHNG
jgi:hypothetical protein